MTFKRIFIVTNFLVEIPSAVFDQLSSVHKPQYALLSMIMSFLTVLISVIDLSVMGRKLGVEWKWRDSIPWFYSPYPNYKPLGSFADIVGLVCGIFQCVFATISFAFLSQHADNPIKISIWPLIFAFGVFCSRFPRTNPRLQNGGSADSSTPNEFSDSSTPNELSDDVEAEATSYFHKLFSGQLTIDAMVQMLALFKESPDRREQLIFECIIGDLFEEYKFFPKYPERQLKVVAVLFGSVIKHQLVTHLTLGIALRGVLDALRKPPDSKMFVFGTKALEQFVDRLIEWPQYCNDILQISHLHGTRSELVSFIEQKLVRISSGQL